MRTVALFTILSSAVLSSGCMLVQPMQEITTGMVRTFKPNAAGYRDMAEEPSDEWKEVGILARGDRPPTQRDPIDRWLSSEKADAIKWNLNYR